MSQICCSAPYTHSLHHIIPVCPSSCLPNGIFSDGRNQRCCACRPNVHACLVLRQMQQLQWQHWIRKAVLFWCVDLRLMDGSYTDGYSGCIYGWSFVISALTFGLLKGGGTAGGTAVAIHTHMLGAATRFHLLDFNMDVCSGFMAAVVTGRNKTSGHLTSLGIRVGAGMGPAKAELFCFGFSRSCHGRRRMEGLMLWRPPRLNGVRPNMDQREREREIPPGSLADFWAPRPDRRPVVWLSSRRGMFGSHRSDHRRVRWWERKIGGWDTEGATSVKHPAVILLKVWSVPFPLHI